LATPTYGTPLAEFMPERTRILEVLAREENREVVLRLVGALAFRTHCPQFGRLQDELGRVFTDIDFAGYSRQRERVRRLLTDLGYSEDTWVTRLFGDQRLVYHDQAHSRHIDVFFDMMKFSHVLPLKGRLEAEKDTLPLAELLLEKMQIVRLNEKDLIDTIMLLREHPVGPSDAETIHSGVISALLAKDWGIWRTVTANLEAVHLHLGSYPQLTVEDRRIVVERIDQLQAAIDQAPKSMAWKTRSLIGDKVKWYEEVEELSDRI
jgi:hypothetical protein